jgi:hypothetical protein
MNFKPSDIVWAKAGRFPQTFSGVVKIVRHGNDNNWEVQPINFNWLNTQYAWLIRHEKDLCRLTIFSPIELIALGVPDDTLE